MIEWRVEGLEVPETSTSKQVAEVSGSGTNNMTEHMVASRRQLSEDGGSIGGVDCWLTFAIYAYHSLCENFGSLHPLNPTKVP